MIFPRNNENPGIFDFEENLEMISRKVVWGLFI